MSQGILDFGKAPPLGGLQPVSATRKNTRNKEIEEVLDGPALFGEPPNR